MRPSTQMGGLAYLYNKDIRALEVCDLQFTGF